MTTKLNHSSKLNHTKHRGKLKKLKDGIQGSILYITEVTEAKESENKTEAIF
jgi:hypothetical protein